jgi:glycosyltransferase involved in cell wall biosynthesis
VVTPTFNQANFLEETIKSVINQKNANFEYYIRDSKSNDETNEILKKYSRKISGWISERDEGQADAINKAFLNCRGDIFCWLNSDDIFLPYTFNKVANFFLNNKNIDIIYSNRLIIDKNSKLIGRWILPRHNNEIIKWVDFIPQETMFWRREAWEKIGGKLDIKFQFAMDWDLISKFRSHSLKFFHVNDFLSCFRFHENQKTFVMINDKGQKEMNIIRKRSLGFIPQKKQIDEAISNYIFRHKIKDKLYTIFK